MHPDYDPSQIVSMVTIPANESQVCFTSTSIEDDSEPQEPDEIFKLRITSTVPTNPEIVISPDTTDIIIVDDDGNKRREIVCLSHSLLYVYQMHCRMI